MEKTIKKKRPILKALLIILLLVIVILIIGWWLLCVNIYNENFNVRGDSYEPLMLRVEDFDGLKCTEYTFPSDRGQMLAGYLYSVGAEQKGIVVIAHGFGGGGHNSYMDAAYYFARNGYYVFAYDATGTDKSEGEGVGGVPQGVIDLDHAISFVEANDDIPDLPIVLFGHSWGGYSACAVLNIQPDVEAVIALAGFDHSLQIIENEGKQLIGNAFSLLLPHFSLYEVMKFGKYASLSAMDGFNNTGARIMIAHSADDLTVPIRCGYDLYYEHFGEDGRFSFIRYQNRGHENLFTDEDGRAYLNFLKGNVGGTGINAG